MRSDLDLLHYVLLAVVCCLALKVIALAYILWAIV